MKKASLVAVLLAAFLAGGFWILQQAVNRRVARVLPEAGRATGIPMRASALELSLWRGAFGVRDLRIGNPSGFAESNLFTLAEGRVSVRYLPLFRKRIRFDDVTVRDADLTIVRSTDGRINVKRSRGAGGGQSPEPGSGQEPSGKPGEPSWDRRGKLPRVAIERLRANLCVRLLDHAASAGAGETLIRMQVISTGLATYGDAADESAWGAVSVEGTVEARDRSAPLRLVARIAPLTDPQAPTFKVNGTITGLDEELLRPFLGKKGEGIRGEAERVEVELVCQEGRFDESRSKLTVTLKNVKMGSQKTPSLTLVIPVHGTLAKPKLRLEQALFGAMAQLLAAPQEPKGSDPAGDPKKHKKNADLGEALSKGLEALFKGKP